MKIHTPFFNLMLSFLFLLTSQQLLGQHLFILSGQSNMVRMDETKGFIPVLENALGKNKITTVKDAHGGQPIQKWFPPYSLYDSLWQKVVEQIPPNSHFETVTFIWMQGERDAREELGELYEEKLRALYQRLKSDLQRERLYFIIGRINDFDLTNSSYPHWSLIREIQVRVGASDPDFIWVDTDDLNDGINLQGQTVNNDLHLTEIGYQILGERFAHAALQLIGN